MECVACGRALTNDDRADNFAYWTLSTIRLPYCGDSIECMNDSYAIANEPTEEAT